MTPADITPVSPSTPPAWRKALNRSARTLHRARVVIAAASGPYQSAFEDLAIARSSIIDGKAVDGSKDGAPMLAASGEISCDPCDPATLADWLWSESVLRGRDIASDRDWTVVRIGLELEDEDGQPLWSPPNRRIPVEPDSDDDGAHQEDDSDSPRERGRETHVTAMSLLREERRWSRTLLDRLERSFDKSDKRDQQMNLLLQNTTAFHRELMGGMLRFVEAAGDQTLASIDAARLNADDGGMDPEVQREFFSVLRELVKQGSGPAASSGSAEPTSQTSSEPDSEHARAWVMSTHRTLCDVYTSLTSAELLALRRVAPDELRDVEAVCIGDTSDMRAAKMSAWLDRTKASLASKALALMELGQPTLDKLRPLQNVKPYAPAT